MRKMLLVCFVLLSFTYANASTGNYPNFNFQSNFIENEFLPIGWPKFHIDVEYMPGCPKGIHAGQKNCIGDCKVCYIKISIGLGMIAPNDRGNSLPNFTGVFLTRDEYTGKLTLVLDKQFGNSKFRNYVLSDRTMEFILSSDSELVIPDYAQQQLTGPASISLKAGTYKVDVNDIYYKINLE